MPTQMFLTELQRNYFHLPSFPKLEPLAIAIFSVALAIPLGLGYFVELISKPETPVTGDKAFFQIKDQLGTFASELLRRTPQTKFRSSVLGWLIEEIKSLEPTNLKYTELVIEGNTYRILQPVWDILRLLTLANSRLSDQRRLFEKIAARGNTPTEGLQHARIEMYSISGGEWMFLDWDLPILVKREFPELLRMMEKCFPAEEAPLRRSA